MKSFKPLAVLDFLVVLVSLDFPTMTRYFLCLLAAFALISCEKSETDPPQEDYDALFPFKGAERPRISYEEQYVRLGDPDAAVADFVYPGVTIPGETRTYRVTLTCSFRETNEGGRGLVAQDEVRSRYIVRYVGADSTLHTLASSARTPEAEARLENGREHVVHFTAKSGHPMYLLVNGVAPRGSSVHATLSAVSEDGFTIVRPLEVNAYQNEEGMDKLRRPFCAYVILP